MSYGARASVSCTERCTVMAPVCRSRLWNDINLVEFKSFLYRYQFVEELDKLQQEYDFMNFFEYVLKNPALLDRFMNLLDNHEEMIYFAAEYGFPLDKLSIKTGIARAIKILNSK